MKASSVTGSQSLSIHVVYTNGFQEVQSMNDLESDDSWLNENERASRIHNGLYTFYLSRAVPGH